MAPHPGAARRPHRPLGPATPAAADDGEEEHVSVSSATELVDPVPGAEALHLPRQPDLLQLLTREGERV